MLSLRAFSLSALCAIAIGCSASPRIQTEASPTANFAAYRSYGWVKVDQPPPVGERLTGLTDWRIRNDVGADLAARGWAVSPGPDVLVDYGIILEQRNTDSFSAYAQYIQEGGREGMSGAFVDGFQQGTLVLHFYDGRTGQLVWRGSASAIVEPTGENADLVHSAIDKMLAQLPRQ